MRKIFILISVIAFIIFVIILADYYKEKKNNSVISNALSTDDAKARLSPADEARIKREEEIKNGIYESSPADEATLKDEAKNRLSPADVDRPIREN